jgi:hypothetical protein
MARGVALGGKRFYWNVDPALGMAAWVVAEDAYAATETRRAAPENLDRDDGAEPAASSWCVMP